MKLIATSAVIVHIARRDDVQSHRVGDSRQCSRAVTVSLNGIAL